MAKTGDSLAAAVQAMTGEDRLTLDAHLSPEELRDYRAGALAAAHGERCQEHLTRCPMCADLLLELAAFPRIEPPEEEDRLSDQDVADAWRAMGPELVAAVRRGEAAATPSASRRTARLRPADRSRSWNPASLLRSAPFAYAMSAVLLIATTILVRTWSLRELSQPATNVHVGSLVSERDGGGTQQIEVPATAEHVLLVLNLADASPEQKYRVEIHDSSTPGGDLKWKRGGLEPTWAGNFNVLVPRRFLPAGGYLIRLHDSKGDGREPLVEYRMDLSYLPSQ